MLVPPGRKGALPKDARRLDVPTSKVWLWRPCPTSRGNEFGLFTQLAAVLKDNPVREEDKALFGQFARIGLTEKGFDPGKLGEPTLRGMRRAMQDAPAVPVASVVGTSQLRDGWNWVTGMDSFGYNYPLRAVVAGPYLGGQGEPEAMYPIRYTDSKSQALTGGKTCTMHFSSPPPVDAFWSLTVYNADDKMLIENPIHRYKVGSNTPGLVRGKDGSFTLTLRHEKPDDASNWVPTPTGGFYLILRLYQPKAAALEGQWQLPQVDPAN